jgi:16S rRNA G527 N7-methylase RsmG
MVAVQQVLLRLAKEMQVLQIQVRPWAVVVVRAAQHLAKMVVWEQPTLLAATHILLREVAVAQHGQEQVEQAYQVEAQEAVLLVVAVQAELQIQAEEVVVVVIKEEAVAQAAQEL